MSSLSCMQFLELEYDCHIAVDVSMGRQLLSQIFFRVLKAEAFSQWRHVVFSSELYLPIGLLDVVVLG